MSISVEFQNRFLELFEEQSFNHTELAEKIGIGYETFSKIKNYGILPTPRILVRIADYFDISLEYLLARNNEEYFSKAKMPETFTQRLETLKESKNLTYYELGKKLHFPHHYFSLWKTKNYMPSLEFLILLAEFFEVSLDYLLGRSDDR